MHLQYGVTSFFDIAKGKPPSVDFNSFKNLAYELAREIGVPILKLESSGAAHNYFFAALSTQENNAILCNAQYPFVTYVAGFEGDAFGFKAYYVEHPLVISIVEKSNYFNYVGNDILESKLESDMLTNLAESEIQQAKEWGCKSVGELIFNYWD
tara:strand:- start:695 stop:1156 length:462 start_codon:yes stop_codon:yes gene_type:complete